MFFNSKPETPEEPKPVAAKVDAYAKLKEFYFKEIDGQKLILLLSNHLKQSNAIMMFDDGTIWRTAYIGSVLEFLNNTIQQLGMNLQLNTAMAKWLDGQLPVNINPQIEISPSKIIDYALQTVQKYPTNEYKQFIVQLESFKQRYDECEIVENLRNKATQ